jgi:AcrR family transcriptional regulator
VEAARQLVSATAPSQVSVGAVARQAGVSRVTVYNQFGSKALLLEALGQRTAGSTPVEAGGNPRAALRDLLGRACDEWSADPALFRSLGRTALVSSPDLERRLAERLAAADALRPGCSIKEAEDVIGALTSFPVFDRLHKDGRRPPAAVAEILDRLAAAILG